MQFENVKLKLERETNATEITRLFEKYGRLRVRYYQLRERLESDLLEEIARLQEFLRENTSVREFDISEVKNAFDISLKMEIINEGEKELLSKGECDLETIIKINFNPVSKQSIKQLVIESFLILLKSEVYDSSYVNVRQAMQKLEKLKKA